MLTRWIRPPKRRRKNAPNAFISNPSCCQASRGSKSGLEATNRVAKRGWEVKIDAQRGRRSAKDLDSEPKTGSRPNGKSHLHASPLIEDQVNPYFTTPDYRENIVSVEDEKVFAGPLGQLTPTGGGDPIPLMKKRLMIGRRGEADIQLKFANVSTQHCRLTLEQGYWFVRDLNSRNGTKVDGRTVMRKRVDPKSTLTIARHEYIIEYEPQALGAYGPPPADDDYMDELMRSSLMDRAGLKKRDQQGGGDRNRRQSLD